MFYINREQSRAPIGDPVLACRRMRIALPDLLVTRKGRLAAFFLLYVTEGIPLGFTAIAIATQMRRLGLGPAAIGIFVGSLYLPWGFKWVVGPLRRHLLVATLRPAPDLDLRDADRHDRHRAARDERRLRRPARASSPAIIFLHNAFAATMDVAIDALAVNVLPEHERGSANGFMFAGAGIGQAIGGSGVLFLTAVMPFGSTYFFVAASILAITVFVVLPLREKSMTRRVAGATRDIGLGAQSLRARCLARLHRLARRPGRRGRGAAAGRCLRAQPGAAIEPGGRARPRRRRRWPSSTCTRS